jgi:hypothetical protein
MRRRNGLNGAVPDPVLDTDEASELSGELMLRSALRTQLE